MMSTTSYAVRPQGVPCEVTTAPITLWQCDIHLNFPVLIR
ncbi:hypothetical protein N801_17460 [Knoellia aerolata DSM 18566]|uniref:Uncharacterized protein n=1 Tax=Knoellia aerolata DSM 18566 TaxID=1385519 RepID=A0A0A0JYB1_9MICO|nr:hypothetical protein N801_17460 [Knoellia aerolata DSM 18566]